MKSHESTLTNVTALPNTTSGPYQTDNDNTVTSNVTRPGKGSPKKPRDHKYNDVIKTSSRPPRSGIEWTKHQKHDEESNPRLQSTTRQASKNFCKEFEANSGGVSSSMETLDSILSPQMDLPPVIELLGQLSSDVLEPVDRGVESNSSGNSRTYRRYEDIANEGMRHRKERPRESTHSNKRDTHSNRETRQNIRDTNFNQRETQSHKQHTRSQQRERNFNKRDTYSHQRATHSNERDARENIPDTHSKQQDLRSNEQDTHSQKHGTHSQKHSTHGNTWDMQSPHQDTHSNQQHMQSSQASTKVFTHPVIKSGNSSNMVSSLRRPVGDVLPSKPLSPASCSPGKFSYTMHSRKTKK